MDVRLENTQQIREDWFNSGKGSGRAFLNWKKSYFIGKRGFDLLFSILIIMTALSWLLPVMALLIKLDSRGPVFFLQKRVGRGGRLFTCYKMRTMIVNLQADHLPAAPDDRRITRMGRILRRTHLDELPQIFNVLSGKMSLVGPRPYMLADSNTFSRMVQGHRLRSLVKPGITGLAQIKGLHGPQKDPQVIFSRYQWDSFYVRNAGFGLDFRILRLTLLNLITQRQPK